MDRAEAAICLATSSELALLDARDWAPIHCLPPRAEGIRHSYEGADSFAAIFRSGPPAML